MNQNIEVQNINQNAENPQAPPTKNSQNNAQAQQDVEIAANQQNAGQAQAPQLSPEQLATFQAQVKNSFDYANGKKILLLDSCVVYDLYIFIILIFFDFLAFILSAAQLGADFEQKADYSCMNAFAGIKSVVFALALMDLFFFDGYYIAKSFDCTKVEQPLYRLVKIGSSTLVDLLHWIFAVAITAKIDKNRRNFKKISDAYSSFRGETDERRKDGTCPESYSLMTAVFVYGILLIVLVLLTLVINAYRLFLEIRAQYFNGAKEFAIPEQVMQGRVGGLVQESTRNDDLVKESTRNARPANYQQYVKACANLFLCLISLFK